LADLHIHYEKVIDSEKTGVVIETKKPEYSVTKMRFKKVGKQVYKDTLIYNDYITIHNIPEKAYEYVINGKSAIEWIMERYAVTVDKASGIVEDPNKYQGSKYIFDLLISVIYVSIRTQELIDSMPEYKEI
jgi:predicted helicase